MSQEVIHQNTDSTDEPAPTDERVMQALDLDDDPDTSLIASLSLHLLSEHFCTDALGLDEAIAMARHAGLHLDTEQQHPVTDLRCRPGRALNVLSLNGVRSKDIQLLVPPPRLRA